MFYLDILRKIFNHVISIGQKLDTILSLLQYLVSQKQQSLSQASSIKFDAIINGEIKENSMETTLTDTQEFTLTLNPTNKAGQPAKVEAGSVHWTGPNFVSIEPSADGMSALIKALTQGPNDLISVTADADLGEGVKTIGGTYGIQVIASQAVSIGFVASEPVEQS